MTLPLVGPLLDNKILILILILIVVFVCTVLTMLLKTKVHLKG